MKIKPDQKEIYERGVARNSDDAYGARVYSYLRDWAEGMELRIAAGETVEQCAEECARVADYDGITGYMHCAAVSILSTVWEHGEALRRWHNLRSQIGTEGERANADGAVLNTAVAQIGDADDLH